MFLCISVLAAGVAFDYGIDRFYPFSHSPFIMILSAITYTALLFTLHDAFLIVKGILFAQLLILAGYIDARTHEIPDELNLLILLIATIQIRPLEALIGLLAVSVPMLIIGIIIKNGVGGGDIKLMAASGAVLGPLGVMEGTVISCAALLLHCVFRISRKKRISRMNAMAPYFSAGCVIAYILENMR